MNGGGETPSTTPYVDLGLPSGLLWRRRNLGATAPEDPGYYYSWGNVEGHAAGSGYNFSQEVYDTTPAAAITTNLSLNQDAARDYLGAPWRMPTHAEFQELYDNCTHEWTALNGINGVMFTSNVNGNKLFFPAAGDYNGTTLDNLNERGGYWSSSFLTDTNAYQLWFRDTTVNPNNAFYRRIGFSIRAVMETTNVTD